MPDIIDEIKEASIKQARQMHEEALKRFGEDFDIDMRQELAKISAPNDFLEPIDPSIIDPVMEEDGEEDDQDSTEVS